MKATLSLLSVLFLLTSAFCFAGSATWKLNPTSADWNTAANWAPATVPNGVDDIAIFGVSNRTKITSSSSVVIDSIVFEPGANAYKIGPDIHAGMGLGGAGVINNSGVTQQFLVANSSSLSFSSSASAGSNVQIIVPGQIDDTIDGGSGDVYFSDSSSAGDGVYICKGAATNNGGGAQVYFLGDATAGTIPSCSRAESFREQEVQI